MFHICNLEWIKTRINFKDKTVSRFMQFSAAIMVWVRITLNLFRFYKQELSQKHLQGAKRQNWVKGGKIGINFDNLQEIIV